MIKIAIASKWKLCRHTAEVDHAYLHARGESKKKVVIVCSEKKKVL